MSTQKKSNICDPVLVFNYDSELSSRHELDLVMLGAFCDQPWPGKDAGDDPGLSRTVGRGDTAHTAHTVRLPGFLLSRFFMRCCDFSLCALLQLYCCSGTAAANTERKGVTVRTYKG